MDGFTGFKTAATKELPDAMTVMDPFHVLRLADDALDVCYHRVQQHLHSRREQKNDPLYKARRALHTGADYSPTDSRRDSKRCSHSPSISRSKRPGASISA